MRNPKLPSALPVGMYPLCIRYACSNDTSSPLLPTVSVRVMLGPGMVVPVPLETGFEETVVSNGIVGVWGDPPPPPPPPDATGVTVGVPPPPPVVGGVTGVVGGVVCVDVSVANV